MRDAWDRISLSLRSRLVAHEMSKSDLGCEIVETCDSTTTVDSASDMSSPGCWYSSSPEISSSPRISHDGSLNSISSAMLLVGGAATTHNTPSLLPLPKAPENVFKIIPSQSQDFASGYRNVFNLPISYDLTIVNSASLLCPSNKTLLDSSGPVLPNTPRTRFACIDSAVFSIHGNAIISYFDHFGVDLTVCVLDGEERNKNQEALDALLQSLCEYKLRRREPFLAIGGGVLLDIAGLAASSYRRGGK